MRYLITILFLYSFSAYSTNYYIDNSGSDLYAGTAPGLAWATIAKVNASTFLPGDSILFNRNGTWNERLIFPSSGTLANPIYIGAYNNGNKPVPLYIYQIARHTCI